MIQADERLRRLREELTRLVREGEDEEGSGDIPPGAAKPIRKTILVVDEKGRIRAGDFPNTI